jgi:twitching motility protein PilT
MTRRNSRQSEGSLDINKLLKKALTMEAIEVLLLVGSSATAITREGRHISLCTEKLGYDDVLKIAYSIMNEPQRESLKKRNIIKGSYNMPGSCRAVFIIFIASAQVGVQFILSLASVKSLSEYPPLIKTVLDSSRHKLIACFGDRNSDDLTDAIVDYFNETRECKILIATKAIRRKILSKKAMVIQLEQGEDFDKMYDIARHLNDFNPDIVCIEDVADFEMITSAINFSFHSIFVIANIRGKSAASVLNRLLHVYPPYQHKTIRQILADNLAGMFGVKGIMGKDGKMLPYHELMLCTKEAQKIIRESDFAEITEMIEKCEHGMVSFDQEIEKLVEGKQVSVTHAFTEYDNKESFMKKYGGENADFLSFPK